MSGRFVDMKPSYLENARQILSRVIGNPKFENSKNLFDDLKNLGFTYSNLKSAKISSLITAYYFDFEARVYLRYCNSSNFKKLKKHFEEKGKLGIFLLAVKTAKSSHKFTKEDYQYYIDVLEYLGFLNEDKYTVGRLEETGGIIRGKNSERFNEEIAREVYCEAYTSSSKFMKIEEFIFFIRNFVRVNARRVLNNLEDLETMRESLKLLAKTYYFSGKKKNISLDDLKRNVIEVAYDELQRHIN